MHITGNKFYNIISLSINKALFENKDVENGIHIKKKNEGKFTQTKKTLGKTTEELMHSENPLTRKRANFAKMAKRHWKPLNENMQVWNNIEDIKNLSKQIYIDNKAFKYKNNVDKKYLFNLYNKKMQKSMPVNVLVHFVKENRRTYAGLSSNGSNNIELYILPTYSIKNIEEILTHELTHQDNKNYNKNKIGHYFGQHTLNYERKKKSKLLEIVNEILYNLWSNDEMSAFQSASVIGFKGLQNKYEYLKECIDSLQRKYTNENDVFSVLKDYLESNKNINFSKVLKHKRMPSLENFKQWFIEESYKRLDKYWTKLKKNWYKYHTEINPDNETEKLSSKNNEIIYLNKSLGIIKEKLSNLVSHISQYITNDFINRIKANRIYGLLEVRMNKHVDPFNDKIMLDFNYATDFAQKRKQCGNGMVKIYSQMVFLNKNKKSYIEYYNNMYYVHFFPNKDLDEILAYRNVYVTQPSVIFDKMYKLIEKEIKELTIIKT